MTVHIGADWGYTLCGKHAQGGDRPIRIAWVVGTPVPALGGEPLCSRCRASYQDSTNPLMFPLDGAPQNGGLR